MGMNFIDTCREIIRPQRCSLRMELRSTWVFLKNYDLLSRFEFYVSSIQLHNSSDSLVVLQMVNLSSSGRYRCEVSGEAPSFNTVDGYGDMVVVGKFIVTKQSRRRAYLADWKVFHSPLEGHKYSEHENVFNYISCFIKAKYRLEGEISFSSASTKINISDALIRFSKCLTLQRHCSRDREWQFLSFAFERCLKAIGFASDHKARDIPAMSKQFLSR